MNEELKCLAGIQKCDEFLKKWDVRGNKIGTINVGSCANEIPPDEVAALFRRFQRGIVDGGADESPDFSLAIFYANAKQGFIMRLARMRELEKQTTKMEAC